MRNIVKLVIYIRLKQISYCCCWIDVVLVAQRIRNN